MPDAEHRAVPLETTYALARRAGMRAGVTRLGDVTEFGGAGLPVFQAIRPRSRSLTVSQGKGLCRLAAKVSALLEAAELHAAERLACPAARVPLAAMPRALADWSGLRDPLAVSLDPARPRGWLPAADLIGGGAAVAPWELLSLDFTRAMGEVPASTVGLATGNTRAEALAAGVAEVLEHDLLARFARLTPLEMLARQLDPATIDDPLPLRIVRRLARAGLIARVWSLGQDAGIAAVRCVIFPRRDDLETLAPVAGSGCHPDRSVALLRAVLEAVQSRATLIAGARDDLTEADYRDGPRRTRDLLAATMGFGEGRLAWPDLPHCPPRSSDHALELLLARTQALATSPVVAFDHPPPVLGLHLTHVLAPGLLDLHRQVPPAQAGAVPPPAAPGRAPRRPPVLFAGPSVASLTIPAGIEHRPPARCGDLAALLADPPMAVGLVDGYFNLAPTVWHKEILALLAVGTRVIGAASLGAVRAAELAGCGMEGVGAVYRAYRAGKLVRDDAVLLLHAPERFGYAPLTVALVDAERALRRSGLSGRALRVMQRIVRRTPYDRRTWDACAAEYRRLTGVPLPVDLAVLAQVPSPKLRDAARLVRRLAAIADASPRRRADVAPPPPRPPPPLTSYLRQLLATTARSAGAGPRARTPGVPAD